MRNDIDPFPVFLREISEIADDLREFGIPNQYVDGFQRACFSLTPVDEKEKAKLFAPLASCFLKLLNEQNSKSVSVRFGGAVPSSIIARATMQMIDALKGNLGHLFSLREILVLLLEVKNYSAKESRKPRQQHVAKMLFGLNPDISSNFVAKRVGVANSTVSRWRKDEGFLSSINDFVDFCANPIGREMVWKAVKFSLYDDEELKKEFEEQ
jgi:hypothetical protein